MADAIVRGVINNFNRAKVDTSLTCRNSVPFGSITGEIETGNLGGRFTRFSFRSSSPSRIIARKAGPTSFVNAVFGRVTLINLRTGVIIKNARIVLTARRNINGRRSATLIIYRPGRNALRVSGFLQNGRIFVGRNVSCQLLLQ